MVAGSGNLSVGRLVLVTATCLVVAIVASSAPVLAAPVNAGISARIAVTDPQPGVPFAIDVDAFWPGELTGDVSIASSSFTGMTVVDVSRRDSGDGNVHRITLRYQLRAERGLHVFPAAELRVRERSGRRLLTDRSAPLYIEVPPGEGAMEAELRPNRDLRQMFATLTPWMVATGLLFVALTGWLLVRRLRRGEDPVDPFQAALDDLDELLTRIDPNELIERHHAYKISRIVRRLIETTLDIPALELTGGELTDAIGRLQGPAASKDLWCQLVADATQLESVKYQEAGRGSQTVGYWLGQTVARVSEIHRAGIASETT